MSARPRNRNQIPLGLALLSMVVLLSVIALWAGGTTGNFFWNGLGANGDWLYLMVHGPATGTPWTGGGGVLDVIGIKHDMNNYIMGGKAWFLSLLFSVLPVLWLNQYRKRRKLGPNACPACGYELTGNESGKCPKCSAVTEKPAESS